MILIIRKTAPFSNNSMIISRAIYDRACRSISYGFRQVNRTVLVIGAWVDNSVSVSGWFRVVLLTNKAQAIYGSLVLNISVHFVFSNF